MAPRTLGGGSATGAKSASIVPLLLLTFAMYAWIHGIAAESKLHRVQSAAEEVEGATESLRVTLDRFKGEWPKPLTDVRLRGYSFPRS